jgi:hypothetical protein
MLFINIGIGFAAAVTPRLRIYCPQFISHDETKGGISESLLISATRLVSI